MASNSGDRSADHTSQHRGDGVPSDGYNRHLTISRRPWCRAHHGKKRTPQGALRIGLLDNGPQRAISSAGERSPHTGEVTGSIPVSPTKLRWELPESRSLSPAALDQDRFGALG